MRARWLTMVLALAVTELSPAPADAGVSLQVTVSGFRNTKGQVLLAVYDSKEAWLDVGRAVHRAKLPIAGGTVVLPPAALRPGVYAVAVVHDENMNEKLDMKVFPPGPAEGTAVSNDATGTFGPPSFAAARFVLGERGGAIVVNLRY